jgi:hypothetical protein
MKKKVAGEEEVQVEKVATTEEDCGCNGKDTSKSLPEKSRPMGPHDPKWVEFILDKLEAREMIDGAPTTDGLRRVTEDVFGQIIGSETEILEIPSTNLKETIRCTAKHTLTIMRYDSMGATRSNTGLSFFNSGTPSGTIKVSACVDVLAENLPSPYNKHLVATACTRAEGKALRRALKIRIITAEEQQNSTEVVDEVEQQSDTITDQQLLAINALCKKLNISMKKLVQRSYPSVTSTKELTRGNGRDIISTLSGFQRASKLDESLLGYERFE